MRTTASSVHMMTRLMESRTAVWCIMCEASIPQIGRKAHMAARQGESTKEGMTAEPEIVAEIVLSRITTPPTTRTPTRSFSHA